MSFDFQKFLSRWDPTANYEVNPVSGGLVNITVRARNSSTGKSIILKYAPPFVASVGPSLPFSQERQAVEAKALRLLKTYTVPQLIEHDAENHVLVLEDLGELPTLTEMLETETLDLETAHRVGQHLGSFFATLHSDTALMQAGFAEIDPDFMYRGTIAPALRYLQEYGHQDCDNLVERLVADIRGPSFDQAFILGDCWTGAVLIGPNLTPVIDWEFAKVGRGVASDIAQLMAHLELHSQCARRKEPVMKLINTFLGTYREQTCKSGASWTKSSLETLSPKSQVLRSSLLLFGRELINNAVEREWNCSCCMETSQSCEFRRRMVERGAQCLRLAMENGEAFVKNHKVPEVFAYVPILGDLFGQLESR